MDGIGSIGKTPDRVRREWAAAGDVDDWFLSELADFFAPDAADDSQRLERVSDVIDRLDSEREEFFLSYTDGDDLVQVDIEHHSRRRPPEASTYLSLPSPPVLLEMCASTCDTGDRIVVRHHYASGLVGEHVATWPFGMDIAVELTAPRGKELAEKAEEFQVPALVRRCVRVAGPWILSAAAAAVAFVALRRRR